MDYFLRTIPTPSKILVEKLGAACTQVVPRVHFEATIAAEHSFLSSDRKMFLVKQKMLR